MAFVLPDIPTEDLLLARANRGDQRAIEQIYESFFPAVYRFIYMQLGDAALSEDISSEVFMKFMDTVGKRTGPRQSLRGWFFKVARNEINRHFGRARQVMSESLENWVATAAEQDLEIQFMHTVDSERARQALRMLSPEQQDVLILRFVEALNLQETADVMGKSTSAIKSLQFRAIDTLRHILSDMKLERHG